MEQQNTRIKVIELFKQAGHAHHEAYIEVDGAHDEWAEWYANYLATKLSTVLKINLSPETLTIHLENFEDHRQNTDPDSNWAESYADQLLNQKS